MTKDKFNSSMMNFTGLCVLAGLLTVPGSVMFWFGVFSIFSDHDPARYGTTAAGFIILLVAVGISFVGDKIKREIAAELFSEE